MLKRARLEPLIPHVHICISDDLPPFARASMTKMGNSYIITESSSLEPDMQIIALAHEIAHIKIRYSGFCMNAGRLLFQIVFYFIKIENKFRNFGEELFVDSIVAPRILAPVAPQLLPLQTNTRRNFIEKRAPYCLKKIICIISDLLVSLIDRKGRFFVGIYTHIICQWNNNQIMTG